MKYTPYTYLIGWKTLGIFYYGVRYAKKHASIYDSGCHPDDLWVTYYTSSKIVKEFIKIHGDPDVIEVRKIFNCAQDAVKWEKKVLLRLDVVNNSKWLNQHGAECFVMNSKIAKESAKKRPPITQETKDKISKSLRGKKRSAEQIENIRRSKMGHVISNETKQKMSDSHKGHKHNISTKNKIGEANSKRIWTVESKLKVSESAKNIKLICPHCEKIGGNVMKRWHFENCKHKK